MTEFLTGAAYRDMIYAGAAAIESHMTEVNELNVFPVPDGDTGTNMTLTMTAATEKLASIDEKTLASLSEVAGVAAGALMRGSRGNSGVILSLLFRGIANTFKDMQTADAAVFAEALAEGSRVAYDKVRKPTEGTMLTVSRLSAAAAVKRAAATRDIEAVLETAIATGEEAVADTINLNPVLKKAGVIDSGGRGYIYIIEAMLRSLRGEEIAAPVKQVVRSAADFKIFDTGEITFTYCTEMSIERSENSPTVESLASYLETIGDSIAIVDDEELVKVHVHTNDPGLALTKALEFGALLQVKIENMREQHTAKIVESDAVEKAAEQNRNQAEAHAPAVPTKPFGMVAVSPGDGITTLFHDLGADSIITGGQTMNPSAEDILAAIESVPAETVFVFPNNKNIIWAAQLSAPLATRRVIVIPTKSVPQGISSMIVFRDDVSPEELESEMNEVRGHVRTLQITHAARDSSFDGQDIKAGQYLALDDETMYFCGDSYDELINATKNKIAESSPELIAVYSGEDASPEETSALEQSLTERFPAAEITAADGGQPVYRFIISIE